MKENPNESRKTQLNRTPRAVEDDEPELIEGDADEFFASEDAEPDDRRRDPLRR